MAIEVMAKLSVDASQAEASISTIAQKEQEIADRKMSLAVDASGALTAVEGVVQKVEGALSGIKLPALEGKNIKIGADTSQAMGAVDGVKSQAESIKNIHGKVTEDTSQAESKLDGLKEKAKTLIGGLGAGFLAGGAAVGLDKSLEAAKANMEQQEQLKVALANTGVAGTQLNAAFAQSEQQAHQMAAAYAQPLDTMRELQIQIAGLGGISGENAKRVQEIGIAMTSVGVPARALRAVIRGASNPDDAAALKALGQQFPVLGKAMDAAAGSGDRIGAIYKALGPALAQIKENADGPVGSMEKMSQTGKDLEIAAGSLIFGILQPAVPILTGIGTVINQGVIPAIGAVTGFIDKNKVAVGVLAAGIGILAVSMNAATVGTTALGIAQKAQAIATGVVTGAQTLLNAVMAANPIVLVVAAIAALAAGAIYLYNNVKPVHDAFDAIWTVIKGVGAAIGAFVSNEIGALVKGFKGVGQVLDGIVHLNFNELKQGAATVGQAIGEHMTAGVAAVGAFKSSIEDSSKSLTHQGSEATAAGSAATDAANQAAGAQQNLQQSIDAANSSFKDQQKAAEDELNSGKIAFERQAEYIRTGYANGQKLSEAQIEAYKNANVKLLAQARLMQDEQKKIKAAGDEFLGTKTKAAHVAKGAGSDPVASAKELATQTAQELEYQLKLAEASKGQKLTDEDKLAVAESYLKTLHAQLDANNKIDAKKKAAAIGAGEQKVTSASNDLTVNAAADAYAKKKKLADDEAAYEKDIAQRLAEARISVMADGADKELAIRKAQYDKDIKFALDAAAKGRALSANETLLKKALDEKYAQDKAKIEQKYAKQTTDYSLQLEKNALSGLQSVLQAELNAKRSFDLLAYNDKKLSLDKEQTALKASLQKGEISYQEYNLKLQELTQQRVNLEKQKTQARWQTEEALAKQAYGSMSSDLSKYIQQEITMYAMQALGNTKAADTAKQNANQTMISALANTIQGFTGTIPIVGPVLGIAAGLALMEGFKALEGAMGFASGGIGMPTLVGERGPEVIAPMKDFSQMSTQLVQTTAQAVARSMSNDQPGRQQGGKHQFNVRVTGQSRTAGRDLVTTYQNESIAQKREQLLPS